MPSDGFPFAVLIGREPDRFRFLGELFQFLDDVLFICADGVFGGEVVLQVHAQVAGGQITDVAKAGLHFKVGAQEFFDGFRLGGRLDDDQVFCHEDWI